MEEMAILEGNFELVTHGINAAKVLDVDILDNVIFHMNNIFVILPIFFVIITSNLNLPKSAK